MSIKMLLDELLTALGHPPIEAPAAIFGAYTRPQVPYSGDWELLEPLRQRGWCVHFDTEGQFFLPGEHSQLIAALLTLAGVTPLPRIRDTWRPGVGWVLELAQDARRLALHAPEPGRELPGDGCALPLVRALVDAWLAPDRVLLTPVTGDQTAFCCVIPQEVCAELRAVGITEPWTEAESQPSRHRLLLPPAWEDDPHPIVRLSTAEADALLAGSA